MKCESLCSVQLDSDQWGAENDENSNWSILIKDQKANFVHSDSCECLLYVEYQDNELHYRDMGLSKELIKIIENAKSNGFKYLMLYA